MQGTASPVDTLDTPCTAAVTLFVVHHTIVELLNCIGKYPIHTHVVYISLSNAESAGVRRTSTDILVGQAHGAKTMSVTTDVLTNLRHTTTHTLKRVLETYVSPTFCTKSRALDTERTRINTAARHCLQGTFPGNSIESIHRKKIPTRSYKSILPGARSRGLQKSPQVTSISGQMGPSRLA